MTYIEGLFIAFDQFINAALGGWPDETLSSRCWRWSRDGVRDWPRRFIDGLPFWKAGHCQRANEGDRKRQQCPPELRTWYLEKNELRQRRGSYELPHRPGLRPPDHGPTR